MKVNLDELNTLPQRRLRFDFNEILDVEGCVKPVVGDMLVWASVGGIHLTGNVQTLLKLSCHVCLRPYFQSLTVEIDEQFASLDGIEIDAHPREKELKKDDFFETLPPDGLLDIDDVVYQAVTLASPVFCRCGDQCPGPPSAHIPDTEPDLADPPRIDKGKPEIDPRWNNLKSLLKPQESTEIS